MYLVLSYRFIDKAAVTTHMDSNALPALVLTLLPWGLEARGKKKKKKRIEKGTRSTYVFKLAYEVRSLEATASIKTEANVQT